MRALVLLVLSSVWCGMCVGQEVTATSSSPNHPEQATLNHSVAYVDGTNYKTIQTAIDALGSSPGIVIVPGGYQGEEPTILPDNVAIWDFRTNGRLKITTHPNENAAGSAVGLWIAAGPLGFTSGNPIANNIVGLYSAVQSTGGIDTWGENPVVDLPSNAPDANLWGSEIDLAAQGEKRQGQYIGLDVVASSAREANPLTAAVRAYTANTNAAGWRMGFDVRGVINCAFCVEGIETGLKLTEDISGSVSPQTVATNAIAGNNEIFIGALLSVDSGINHEDVRITSMSGITYSVTGIFRKNHLKGTVFTVYSGDRILESGNTVTALYPYHLGSLRSYTNSHTASVLGFSVDDNSGIERLAWFFPRGQQQTNLA